MPPAAVSDRRYFIVAMAAGVVMFLWYSPLSWRHGAIQLFDAAGLALFAVAGASKARSPQAEERILRVGSRRRRAGPLPAIRLVA